MVAAQGRLGAAARIRLLSLPHEPLFLADWDRALMIHYEVDAASLQRVVPFQLDLCDGVAYVSLVAFTLRRMRPRIGGRLFAWAMKPIATHHFLNVRTYVRCGDETGIYFLAEWLANRLSVALGPRVFGLPYRYGAIQYQHEPERGFLRGRVAEPSGPAFAYHGTVDPAKPYVDCDPGSLTENLMERYTAFTSVGDKARFFRVWHLPWQQHPVNVEVTDRSLLEANWDFFRDARLAGANYCAGVTDVWMGWPHRLSLIGSPHPPPLEANRQNSLSSF
jgi:uncharacterized protein YqjF (DUF2071 family)